MVIHLFLSDQSRAGEILRGLFGKEEFCLPCLGSQGEFLEVWLALKFQIRELAVRDKWQARPLTIMTSGISVQDAWPLCED